MSIKIHCDNCDVTDDWKMEVKPFFIGGCIIKFRKEDGSDEILFEKELCSKCTEELLDRFPKLDKGSVIRRV